MEIDKLKSKYLEFQTENEGFGNLILLSKEGEIIFSLDPNFIGGTEAKELMDSWLNHKSAFVIGENRYPILSWEELQFAARNVKGKGAIIGTRTKSNEYTLVHLSPASKIAPTMGSIKLNRWVWDLE